MPSVHPTNRRRMIKLALVVGAFKGLSLREHGTVNHQAAAFFIREVATPAASPGATPQSGETAKITMTNDVRFDPAEIVIGVGTTVEWVNTSEMPHTATGDPGQNPFKKTRPELIVLPDTADSWGSELMQPGDKYRHTFTVPGDYLYICFPHVLSGMTGKIVVEG